MGSSNKYQNFELGNEEERPFLSVEQKKQIAQKAYVVARFPFFIVFVSIVDVAVMIAAIVYNKGIEPFHVNPWLGPSIETLMTFQAKDSFLMQQGQYWRFVTPIFLHIGILHLLLNMLGQLPIGIEIERRIGTIGMIILYLLSGIGGNILSATFLPRAIQAGASGSLFGVCSFFLIDYIVNSQLYVKPWRKIILWIVATIFSLALGLLPGLDNFAHMGGSLTGIFASILVIRQIPFRKIFPSFRTMVILRIVATLIMLGTFAAGLWLFFVTDLTKQCKWCEYVNCLEVFQFCKKM
eukprot:TRINITY_DN20046_c0_g1_i1.p1 TRINITY_DN20046_c0_g1~~TRINITY_DN20046_c0_g1_i1.p1  ORF type:complete len:325 (-),score=32.29 TRINITY_DN20046_c0_g1_i1:21-905(-)